MSEKYNGWSNWESFTVALWINNEEGSQDYWIEQGKQALEDAQESKYFTKEEEAVFLLAEELKAFYEDSHELTLEHSGLYYDLLMGALQVVDWREVAESLLETAKENV